MLQAEGAGALGNGLTDAAHPDNTEALAGDAMAEHPCRRPPLPVAVGGQYVRAFGEPPRHCENQRHGHVSGVLGQNAGRVGDSNAALQCGGNVDIIDPVAEIGDQLQPLAGMPQHRGVDAVGHRRHQHVGDLHRLGELGRAHRLVVEIQPGLEQLAHARLDIVGQFARYDDQRLFSI
jgi:hypothetical protein